MKKSIPLALASLLVLPVLAQDHLAAYIDTGLNNNLVLKDKHVSLEQSLLSLKNARSYFLPSVAFNVDYLTAEGGRIIPVRRRPYPAI